MEEAPAAGPAALRYPLLLLGVAFAVEAPIAARGHRPAVHNPLDYYFLAGRARAYLDAALRVYRPPLLDILPIYIIFVALSSLLLLVGSRRGWKLTFGVSSALWLFAQFGFRSFAHQLLSRALALHIPLNSGASSVRWRSGLSSSSDKRRWRCSACTSCASSSRSPSWAIARSSGGSRRWRSSWRALCSSSSRPASS